MAPLRAGEAKLVTHKKMKHDTLMEIINAVRQGYDTKKSIQEKYHFSWGTCSESINYLENIEILRSRNRSSPKQPGPPGNVYSINREKFLIMGLEVGVGTIHATVSALDGTVVFSTIHLFGEELNNANAREILKDAFYKTIERASLSEKQIYAAGFALTGALDRDRMIWMQSPLFKGIDNLDFREFQTALPEVRHLYISHDVQCRAMDIVFARSCKRSEFILLHVSEGVGMAAYEGGKCISGHRGLAGEIGHIPYPGKSLIPGTPCFCGKSNCLETFLSHRTLVDHYNRERGEGISDLHQIDKDSRESESLYKHQESLLLYTCIILANIFDTSCIIISGKSVDPWADRFKSEFPGKLKRASWENGPEELIWIDEAGTSASHGACLLHLEHFYSRIVQEHS